jgi:hypothetical protein
MFIWKRLNQQTFDSTTLFFAIPFETELGLTICARSKGPTLDFGFQERQFAPWEQSLFRLMSLYSGAKVAPQKPDLPAF